MAFWSRLRQSKLKFNLFQRVYNRCYTLNHSEIVADHHIRSHTVNRWFDNLDFIVQNRPSEFRNVRFYAKKSYKGAFQKKEETDPSKPMMNEEITAPMVRLVTDEDHFVISRHEALARAKNLNLDLVEVDKHSTPPVCKIFDYKKQKYVQRTKEKERVKSKEFLKTGSCKEIRFAAKINQKDLKMKADLAKRLMENCHRVKCTAIDPTDQCDLPTLLSRFRALIKDFSIEESAPKVETKQAFVVVRHIKFGAAKSGGKKASKSNSQQSNENGLEVEPVDPEEEAHSDEGGGTKDAEWSVHDGDGDDDINTAFDINKENYDQQHKSQQPPIVTAPPIGNRYARDPAAGNPPRNPNQTRPNRPFENSHGANVPNSPSKSSGNFGGNHANAAPSNHNAAAGNNRYKRNGPPSDPARNPTAMDPRMKRGPGGGNPREGGW